MAIADTTNWRQGWGFEYDDTNPSRVRLPDGTISYNDNWQNGWGFQWQSPSGNINDPRATTRPTGTGIGGGNGGLITTPQADSSARIILAAALGQYGLAALGDWAWQKWQAGESVDQIMLELRDTTEYKTRFPAMETLSKSGHAITEAQYINYEQSAMSIFKAAGLPTGFYDQPSDFAGFLTNNVALPELQTRIQMYQEAVFNEPQEVRDILMAQGVTPGDMTAYFIDPDKALPIIQLGYGMARAGGYSQHAGFGDLTGEQSVLVARQNLNSQQLAQGFGTLTAASQLYTGLIGSGEWDISKDTALSAAFESNAQDQAIIEQRKQQRLAAFAGGGGVTTTQTGAVGAGAAR